MDHFSQSPIPIPSSDPLTNQSFDPHDFCNPCDSFFPSRPEAECRGTTSARKVQKADREKLRRDRLNEKFVELGIALDPDRPKNCKATILSDTVQMLMDLTAQLNKLKAEHSALSEESRELSQEKNDLRQEKTSLKSDIENLNVQYQQILGSMFQWSGMDHSVVMAQPSYPIQMPIPIPAAPIPMRALMHPYANYSNQNPRLLPNHCSMFVPYVTPNTLIGQPSPHPFTRPHNSGKQGSISKSSEHQHGSGVGKTNNSNDVVMGLELKTLGSKVDQVASTRQISKKVSSRGSNNVEGSSLSRCSSSQTVQELLTGKDCQNYSGL